MAAQAVEQRIKQIHCEEVDEPLVEGGSSPMQKIKITATRYDGKRSASVTGAYVFARSISANQASERELAERLAQEISESERGRFRCAMGIFQFQREGLEQNSEKWFGVNTQTPWFSKAVKYSMLILFKLNKQVTFISGHMRNIFSVKAETASREVARENGYREPHKRNDAHAKRVVKKMHDKHYASKPRDFDEYSYKKYLVALRADGSIFDGCVTEYASILLSQYPELLKKDNSGKDKFDLEKAEQILATQPFVVSLAYAKKSGILGHGNDAYLRSKVTVKDGVDVLDFGILPPTVQIWLQNKLHAYNKKYDVINKRVLFDALVAQGQKKAKKLLKLASGGDMAPTYFVESGITGGWHNRYSAGISPEQKKRVKEYNERESSKLSYYEGFLNAPWDEVLLFFSEGFLQTIAVEVSKATQQLLDLVRRLGGYALHVYNRLGTKLKGEQFYRPVAEEQVDPTGQYIFNFFDGMGPKKKHLDGPPVWEYVHYREGFGVRCEVDQKMAKRIAGVEKQLKHLRDQKKFKEADALEQTMQREEKTGALDLLAGNATFLNFLMQNGDLLSRVPYVRRDMKVHINNSWIQYKRNPRAPDEAEYYYLEMKGGPKLLKKRIEEFKDWQGQQNAQKEEKKNERDEVLEVANVILERMNALARDMRNPPSPEPVLPSQFMRIDKEIVYRSYEYERSADMPLDGCELALLAYYKFIGDPITVRKGRGYTEMVLSEAQLNRFNQQTEAEMRIRIEEGFEIQQPLYEREYKEDKTEKFTPCPDDVVGKRDAAAPAPLPQQAALPGSPVKVVSVDAALANAISDDHYDMGQIEAMLSQSVQIATSKHLGRSMLHWAIDHYALGNTDLIHVGFILNALKIQGILDDSLRSKDDKGWTPLNLSYARVLSPTQGESLNKLITDTQKIDVSRDREFSPFHLRCSILPSSLIPKRVSNQRDAISAYLESIDKPHPYDMRKMEAMLIENPMAVGGGGRLKDNTVSILEHVLNAYDGRKADLAHVECVLRILHNHNLLHCGLLSELKGRYKGEKGAEFDQMIERATAPPVFAALPVAPFGTHFHHREAPVGSGAPKHHSASEFRR